MVLGMPRQGMVTTHVAFLRNVNQGQRGQPSTGDVIAAFADAGCPGARAFQSNGTVVFTGPEPERVAADVEQALTARMRAEREVFTMPLAQVAAIVDAHGAEADSRRRELTLHHGGALRLDDPDVIRETARRRCRLVDAGIGWTVAQNERDGESNATPSVERITGLSATSRGLPTLIRLVDRFAT